MRGLARAALAAATFAGCAPSPPSEPSPRSAADLLVRGGTVYDGSGGKPYAADIAIAGDSIVAVDRGGRTSARDTLDARGLAVAPGFINMLSWGFDELLQDGRGESDLRQGVTLEIFGEGQSPGPVNERVAREMLARGDTAHPWGFGEALDSLVARGVSMNVASFVGATTLRMHEVGTEDRAPTAEELARMESLVRQAMEEGALGVGTSLIYPPASYSTTAELIALAKASAPYGGMYISHMRGEGEHLLEAADELLTISREAGVPAEIYHIKAAGRDNWGKFDALLAKVDSARKAGLRISADMYTYPASSTGLTSRFPTWSESGGFDSLLVRLKDSVTRARVAAESDMREPTGILLVGFRSAGMRPLIGKTLADIATERGVAPGGRGDGSRRRGPEPHRRGLLQHGGGERAQSGADAVGELRVRRRGLHPRRLGAGQLHPPARLRQLRPAARPLCPGGEADHPRGGGSPAHRPAGREPGSPAARTPGAR